ncbi:CLC4F protein, partial [Amia calva]|nr:CLC4F protein [Amia calva]
MKLQEMPHKPAEGNRPVEVFPHECRSAEVTGGSSGSSAQTREGGEMYLYRVKMISLAVLCILLGTYVMFLKYHNLHTRDCKVCPVDWEINGGKCYFFSTDEKNWDESRDDCVRRGGHLAIIGTEEEQIFITIRMNGCKDVGEKKYWIGLTDAAAEGVWRWVDNTPLRDLK